jgi:hypothetical protein
LVYEEKVDGWRMLAYKDRGPVKLISRNGRDHTKRFRGIAAAIRAMSAPTLVLDGEVAVFDGALVSRFEWLRHAAPPDLATPPIFMAFDCLYHRGQDLRPRPLATRRNVLEDVLDGQDLVLPVRRLVRTVLGSTLRTHGFRKKTLSFASRGASAQFANSTLKRFQPLASFSEYCRKQSGARAGRASSRCHVPNSEEMAPLAPARMQVRDDAPAWRR